MSSVIFPTSNYMTRQQGFRPASGLGQAEASAQLFFSPIHTFGENFRDMLRQIKALGFESIDLWTGHLGWAWATNEHMQLASELLVEEGVRVISICGSLGETLDEFETACHLAVELGAPLLISRVASATSSKPLPALVPILREHDLRLAVCNRPEDKTPAQQLAAVTLSSHGTIGTCLDTGMYASNGYDPALAPAELGETLFHVRLGDVRALRAMDNCELGTGLVDYRACLAALAKAGYGGPISVTLEALDYDPSAECAASLSKIQSWLA